jgi:hypothetical protein
MPTFLCTPNALTWQSATSATVEGIDPSSPPVTLPLEHRDADTYEILKSTYPDGIILIPTDNDPVTNPAILPGVVSSGASLALTLDPEDPDDMPHGGIARFVD